MSQEILVLCPFGVDEGLLSKAAELSGGTPLCAAYRYCLRVFVSMVINSLSSAERE